MLPQVMWRHGVTLDEAKHESSASQETEAHVISEIVMMQTKQRVVFLSRRHMVSEIQNSVGRVLIDGPQ